MLTIITTLTPHKLRRKRDTTFKDNPLPKSAQMQRSVLNAVIPCHICGIYLILRSAAARSCVKSNQRGKDVANLFLCGCSDRIRVSFSGGSAGGCHQQHNEIISSDHSSDTRPRSVGSALEGFYSRVVASEKLETRNGPKLKSLQLELERQINHTRSPKEEMFKLGKLVPFVGLLISPNKQGCKFSNKSRQLLITMRFISPFRGLTTNLRLN